MKKLTLIFLLLFSVSFIQAQELLLKIIINDSIPKRDHKAIHKSFHQSNYFEISQKAQRALSELNALGYLTASMDSIVKKDSLTYHSYYSAGNKYRWAGISPGNVDEGILSEIKFREKVYKKSVITPDNVFQLHERLLKWCENNGYPFASVKFDSVLIQDEKIRARLNLTLEHKLAVDSILIKGTAKISRIYIYNYLSVKPGMLYNESVLKKMNSRLSELPFIKSVKNPEVIFNEKNATIYLFLEDKKASELDGLLGFLPDNSTGKLLVTGQAHVKLQNPFTHGETIELDWRKLQPKTQDFKTRFIYPFLFSTPFGADVNFKIYKRDTSFIDVNQNIGLQYILKGGNYFKVFVNNRNTSLISTKGLENLNSLPPYADIQTLLYGIGLKNEKLDYRFNPRNGYRFNVNTAAGFKNIRKNEKLNPKIYEGLELKTAQYTFDFLSDIFIPVKKRTTINLSLDGAGIIGKNIFVNELYRIGGLRSFRGFDEESIYASSYYIGTIEYRYLLEQNSYWYAFFDGAYYENISENAKLLNNGKIIHDTPFGFGTGVSFETKAGIFTINYAVGKQFNNPIDIRSAKIHFGIVSIF